MIKSILLSNQRGQDINLVLDDPYETGIAIKNITGLGYSKTNVSMQNISSANISFYKNAKVESRNIVMQLIIIGGDLSVEATRQLLYDVLIIGSPIYIEVVTSERSLYSIGYVETVEPDIFSEKVEVQISFICPNPYLYTGNKVTQVFYKNEGIKKLQFSKKQLYNWFDISRTLDKKNPISELNDENIFHFDVVSRFNNPTGFILQIAPLENSDGFNSVKISYENGSIEFKGNDIYEQDGNILKNYFRNRRFIIQNDVYDQSIKSQIGSSNNVSMDIINECIINGDFPSLSIGKNVFEISTYGFVKEETRHPMIKKWESENDTFNSLSYGMLDLNMNNRCEYAIMDVYILETQVISFNKYNFIDDTIRDGRLFLFRFKLTCPILDQKISSDGTYKYRMYNSISRILDGDDWKYGIKADKRRSKNPTDLRFGSPIYSAIDPDDGLLYWYFISIATIYSLDITGNEYPKSAKKVMVELIKSNFKNKTEACEILMKMFNDTGMLYLAHYDMKMFVEKVIPEGDTNTYYNYEYVENSETIKTIVEYDEFVDGM